MLLSSIFKGPPPSISCAGALTQMDTFHRSLDVQHNQTALPKEMLMAAGLMDIQRT